MGEDGRQAATSREIVEHARRRRERRPSRGLLLLKGLRPLKGLRGRGKRESEI
jgi:hypothetical protein